MTRNGFDFDTPVDRRGSDSLKWARYAGRDVLPLWVADMDFPAPACVLNAVRERVDHGVFGYGLPPEGLAEAVVAHAEARYGWRVDPGWLLWLPGLVTGINVACRAVGGDGDGVAVTPPVYPPFLKAPSLSGRERVEIPLDRDGAGWRLDPERLERMLTPRTRLLLLCHPHNPVGRAFTAEELRAVAEVCLRKGVTVCSDEIHCDLMLDERPHVPTASLGPEIAAATITLMAPSKTWNIPGLGCSFAVIPDGSLRRRFRKAMAGIVPHVNVLGYAAALGAYREGEPWRRALLDYLRTNRDRLAAWVVARPPLSMSRVEATYLGWIDARGLGVEDSAAFFEAAGVGLSGGRDFGGPGFVRLNFGCPRATLDEALRRMDLALAKAP